MYVSSSSTGQRITPVVAYLVVVTMATAWEGIAFRLRTGFGSHSRMIIVHLDANNNKLYILQTIRMARRTGSDSMAGFYGQRETARKLKTTKEIGGSIVRMAQTHC